MQPTKFILLIAVALAMGFVGAARAADPLPGGFADALVTDAIDQPTDIAFAANGRMFVTSQLGKLYEVFPDAATAPALLLDLGSKVCSNSERGLLSVTPDPQFASNGYLYLYYTFKRVGQCPTNQPTNTNNPVNRVARFTLSGAQVDPASELVLVDNMPSPNGNHNSGDTLFGKDGYLYVTIGDGGCDYANNSGCAGGNDATRDRNVLTGKLLRIARDGSVPADNPYTDPATSARCNLAGRTSEQSGGQPKWCQEIYATGLRNPFRMALNPDASGTVIYLNDVGQNLWEEIDWAAKGADYGWNEREGPCANNARCAPPFSTPPGTTAPLYAYRHDVGANCGSITAGVFVPQSSGWPAGYLGSYLYSDYNCQRVYRLAPGTAEGFAYVAQPFGGSFGGPGPIAMTFGQTASGTALYYTIYSGGGEVRRISYANSDNRPPTAVITTDMTSGTAAPLAVRFDGTGSSDPDGNPLTYSWSFGDGGASADSIVSHSYISNGIYTATLTVADSLGARSNAASVRIDVGNSPPTATIVAPAADARYAVGETIALRGSGSDPEDGSNVTLTWHVLIRHNDHTHPYAGPIAGAETSVRGPAPEDLAATTTSSLEIQLTATDRWGRSTTATRLIQPRTMRVTIGTSPVGYQVIVNGVLMPSGTQLTSWQGYGLTIDAPLQSGPQGWRRWASWSQGGARSQTIVTGSAPATYTATFIPTPIQALPNVVTK